MSGNEIVKVPVRREIKSLAEHQRNRLANLESDSSPLSVFDRDWSNQVQRRINTFWHSIDDEMRRMQHNMFSLMPLETFGMPRWNGLDNLANPFKLMGEMERDMQDFRTRIDKWNDAPLVGCTSDFLKDAYQLGDDGKLNFNVKFDVRGFEPEDINVTCSGNKLSVHAKQSKSDGSSKSVREFCRIIEMPRSIDAGKMQSRLTNDGVLMLEAPVANIDYNSITFDDKGRVGIRPQTEKQFQLNKKNANSNALVVRGKPGLSIIDGPTGGGNGGTDGKRLHLELPVDGGFDPKDVSVTVDSHRINVVGKRHDEKRSGHSRHSSEAEFSYSYAIPETVDPMTIDAAILGSTLVIDAPLTKSSK